MSGIHTRGFTIVETIVTIAVFVIFIIAVTQLYVLFGRTITSDQSALDIALDGSAIIDTVRTAGLQASHVASSHTFSGVSYASGTSTVIFQLPSVDASGNIIGTSLDYVGITASTTNVYRLIDAAAGSVRPSGTKQISNTLGALQFTYDNVSFPLVTNVIIDATSSAILRGQTLQTHLRDHVYLRNL